MGNMKRASHYNYVGTLLLCFNNNKSTCQYSLKYHQLKKSNESMVYHFYSLCTALCWFTSKIWTVTESIFSSPWSLLPLEAMLKQFCFISFTKLFCESGVIVLFKMRGAFKACVRYFLSIFYFFIK